MSELKPDQLQLLKNKLITFKTELEQQLQLGKKATDTVVLDQSAIGRVSRIDAIQQQSVAISTQGKAMARLKKVSAALIAINQDDYGYCQNCSESIDFKRLQVQPESALCLACQSKSDGTN